MGNKKQKQMKKQKGKAKQNQYKAGQKPVIVSQYGGLLLD